MLHSNLDLEPEWIYSTSTYSVISLISNYLIIFPMSLIENLHGFRYISIIAMASIVYCTIILLIQLPKFYAANYSPEVEVVANWDVITFMQGFSICVFAFNCQNHILPIYGELERKSTRRIKKVITRAVFVMWFLYFFIGMSGYFSTFNRTPRIVLERKSLDGDYIDTTILIGIIALVILLLIHSPVNYFPCRLILAQLAGSEEVSRKQNYVITSCFFSCVVIVAIIFPNITSVLSIIGGLCAVTQSYVLPTLMFLKLSHKSIWNV
jgi:amino acid permease